MGSTDVISYLQSQYSGRLVLYVDDIAQLLGRSEKAIAHLISRKTFPFEIKKVGGLRCIDIFQVAQWVSSKAELAKDVVKQPTAAPAAVKSKSKRPKSSVPEKLAEPDSKEPLTGLMAAEILQARRKFMAPMQRFVSGLRNPEEVAFMHEVQAKLFDSEVLQQGSYVVTIERPGSRGYKPMYEVKTFESVEQGCDFLLTRLHRARLAKYPGVVDFVLKLSDETLFHAYVTGGYPFLRYKAPNFTFHASEEAKLVFKAQPG